MSQYMNLIGQNAKEATLEKINTKVKNKILNRYASLLDKEKNSECARGLSSFSSDEILRIMGHHSKEIEKILGYVAKSEVIHKDDMVEV